MREGVSELKIFLQQLWLDWQRQDLRNDEHGSWEYTDEYFYPLYGIGSLEADVMAVGRAPGYNVGDNNFGPRREVEGPPSGDPTWEPNVKKVAFSDQAERFKIDRLADQDGEGNKLVQGFLQLVAATEALSIEETKEKLADNPFQSIYFTNYRKDGEFADSKGGLDETFDFWEPALAHEIELLDPDVIIAFTEAVTHRVTRILDSVDVPDRSLGPTDTCLEMWGDEPHYVIPSIHWSGINRNLGNVNPSRIPDHLTMLNQQFNRDGYFDALGTQIDRALQ